MLRTDAASLLRRWVQEHEVTAAEICRATGVKPPQMCHILKGRRPISLAMALRLSGYTGIPVEKLVDRRKIFVVRTHAHVA